MQTGDLKRTKLCIRLADYDRKILIFLNVIKGLVFVSLLIKLSAFVFNCFNLIRK